MPVNTAFKGEMLKHICQDSMSEYIITGPELAERLRVLGLDLNVIDPSILTDGSIDEPQLSKPMEPWDIHAIVYTSGTTGPSKGVLPYFQIYMSSIVWLSGASSDDTFLIDHPLLHRSGIDPAVALWSCPGRPPVSL